MKSVQRLTKEIKQLNERLDSIGSQNRFMVYSTNRWKFSVYNFFAGMWYSLGMLFGTAVVATVVVYFLSRMDFTKPLSAWVENTLSQIKWERIISVPNADFGQKIIETDQIIVSPAPTQN